MEVKAISNNVRVSPQKVRLVVAQIKKMKPTDAVKVLEFVPQKSAKPLRKAIASAIANAKNNLGLTESSLTFGEINIGKGISFKRYRPISRGRAHSILRQTSNIRIVLTGDKEAKSKTPENTEKKTENTDLAKNPVSDETAKEKRRAYGPKS